MKIDYILSSVRPFSESGDYAAHQKRAIESWQKLDSKIILFNKPEDVKPNPPEASIAFNLHAGNPPKISEMIDWVLSDTERDLDTVIALVNSDIILDSIVSGIAKVARDYHMGKGWAATSSRYEFAPGTPLSTAKVIGQGLDIFIAHRRVWDLIYSEIFELKADLLTLGRGGWDNWLNSFLRVRLPSHRYVDLTSWRCVFHPLHERDDHLVALNTADSARAVSLSVGGLPPSTYPKPELQTTN